MTKEIEGAIQADVIIIEAFPATQFRIELGNGHNIITYLCGKMRRY